MRNHMFRGSIVALVTPLLDDKVDTERLRELVEFHITAGTQGIVAGGTTGEAGTLSHDEVKHVIKTVIDQAAERIPIIAGTAANATRDCIELTEAAMKYGAHAVLIMTPAYIKPTQEGLYQHYSHVARSVAIPIILYNVPSRTACDMLPETVERLAQHSNIVGIKEATGHLPRLKDLLERCQDKIDVFSGDDITAAEWMLAGAKGVISVTANVAPNHMVKLCEAALQDRDACLSLQEALLPLHEQLFVETNPIPVKWAVNRMGLMGGEIRLPLTRLSAGHQAKLEHVMHSLNLI